MEGRVGRILCYETWMIFSEQLHELKSCATGQINKA